MNWTPSWISNFVPWPSQSVNTQTGNTQVSQSNQEVINVNIEPVYYEPIIPNSTKHEGSIYMNYGIYDYDFVNRIRILDDDDIFNYLCLSRNKFTSKIIDQSNKTISILEYLENLRKLNILTFNDNKASYKTCYYFDWEFELHITEEWENIPANISNVTENKKRQKEYKKLIYTFHKNFTNGIAFRKKYYHILTRSKISNEEPTLDFIKEFVRLYKEVSEYINLYNSFMKKLNYFEKKRFLTFVSKLEFSKINLRYTFGDSIGNNIIN